MVLTLAAIRSICQELQHEQRDEIGVIVFVIKEEGKNLTVHASPLASTYIVLLDPP
jgi:hypothetical protein